MHNLDIIQLCGVHDKAEEAYMDIENGTVASGVQRYSTPTTMAGHVWEGRKQDK